MSSQRIWALLHRTARDSRARLTLGAALSLMAALELDSRTCHHENDDNHNTRSHLNHYRSIYSPLVTYAASTWCEGRSSVQSSASDDDNNSESQTHKQKRAEERRALLRTRKTVHRMEQDSIKDSLETRYDVDWKTPLGEGSFGVVYLGMEKFGQEAVAVKKIGKKHTNAAELQLEMRALMHLRDSGGHPNICSLREHFVEGDYYYLILDLVAGGELFDALVSQGAYSELDAARHIREAASALAFMHGVGVTHCKL